MKYIRGDLSKVASWYYHNDYNNPIRFEIYEAIEGKSHDKCIIEYTFSEETTKAIENTLELIENENKRK